MSSTEFESVYDKAFQEYSMALSEMESTDDLVEKEAAKYPIRQIFRDWLPKITCSEDFNDEQKKAADRISKCKTTGIGMNASFCPNCNRLFLHYASCSNRNCPCCQYPSQQAWIEQRKNEVIPDTPYFHIILTVPHLLNDLILANPKTLLSALFRSSSEAVLELCREKRFLGATPGIISVLHTWSQRLLTHFHMHMIVSAGGLDRTGRFVSLSEKELSERQKDANHQTGQDSHFFLPMSALKKLFRGKMMDTVRTLLKEGKLAIPSENEDLYLDPGQWNRFCSKLYSEDWVGKIVQTFQGRGNAIEYLARYTFKTAICNNRIVGYDGKTVTICITDRDSGKKQEYPMPAMTFISRFLTHVLPKGFTRVRYSGILSNARKKKSLSTIYRLLKRREYTPSPLAGASKAQIFKELYHIDFNVCSCCGERLIRLPRGRPDWHK